MRRVFDKDQIRSMVEVEGLSLSEVSRRLDTKVSTMSTFCKRNNIKSKHVDKAAEKQLPMEEIYNLYISGTSMFELAKIHCTPEGTIKRKLLKLYPNIRFRTHDEVTHHPLLWNKDWLTKQLQTKSMRAIASEIDVRAGTVCAAANHFGLSSCFKRTSWDISTDELTDLYVINGLTPNQIARLCNKSYGVVMRKLRNCGFEIRKSGGMARDSKHPHLNDRSWLEQRYSNDGFSLAQIAETIGTSIGNVAHHFKKHGIKTRSRTDVYKRLLVESHGRKQEINGVYCDSNLEVDFVRSLPDNTQIIRNVEFENNNSYCYVDFKIDNEYIEVKPREQALLPGPNRRRLIKQITICKNNGVDLKVWSNKFVDVNIDDIDIYYAMNWRLFFDDHVKCSDWLIKFGFHGVEYPINELRDAVKHIIRVKEGEELNANYQNIEVLKLIKHFSQHYWWSTHKDYISIPKAWDVGNRSVLRTAVKELWEMKKEINIYGLINKIQHGFKDFAAVSIFKPWIASEIYKRFLPDGGVVLDPCMGWGGRLLGTADKQIKYIGIDINSNSVSSHNKLYKFVKSRIHNEPVFIAGDSAAISFPESDLIFTSPPYNDCELYHGINSAETLTEPILINIFRQSSCPVVLNVPPRLEDKTIESAKNYGYKLDDRLMMKTASFMGRKKTSEPILIFKK